MVSQSQTQWDGSDRMPCPHLPHNTQIIRATGGRPVCLQANTSTIPILQLETRPSSRGSGCLPTGLEHTEGLCQPSMVPDRQGFESSPPTTGSSSAGSACVEGSELVPSSSGDVARFSMSDHSSSRPDPEANRLTNGGDTSTSRVAYLRQRFSGKGLSDEASRLLLCSWRSKSAQSYNSHFRKWAGWCAE